MIEWLSVLPSSLVCFNAGCFFLLHFLILVASYQLLNDQVIFSHAGPTSEAKCLLRHGQVRVGHDVDLAGLGSGAAVWYRLAGHRTAATVHR